MDRIPKFSAAGLLALWCAAVASGFYWMARYDVTPGARAGAPSDWPSGLKSIAPELALARGSTKTLVLFAHPRCPCTRATIGNIAVALAREPSASSLRIYVVFYEPLASAGPEWTNSDLVRSAQRLPNAAVLFDPGGRIIRRFGAETSGDSLVYDSSGRLLFSGGVTDERGHYGDSAGGAALAALSRGERPTVSSAPVFGCSLLPAHAAPPRFAPTAKAMSMDMPMDSYGTPKQ